MPIYKLVPIDGINTYFIEKISMYHPDHDFEWNKNYRTMHSGGHDRMITKGEYVRKPQAKYR